MAGSVCSVAIIQCVIFTPSHSRCLATVWTASAGLVNSSHSVLQPVNRQQFSLFRAVVARLASAVVHSSDSFLLKIAVCSSSGRVGAALKQTCNYRPPHGKVVYMLSDKNTNNRPQKSTCPQKSFWTFTSQDTVLGAKISGLNLLSVFRQLTGCCYLQRWGCELCSVCFKYLTLSVKTGVQCFDTV